MFGRELVEVRRDGVVYGLYASRPLQKGQVVAEYAGELISAEEYAHLKSTEGEEEVDKILTLFTPPNQRSYGSRKRGRAPVAYDATRPARLAEGGTIYSLASAINKSVHSTDVNCVFVPASELPNERADLRSPLALLFEGAVWDCERIYVQCVRAVPKSAQLLVYRDPN